MRAAPWLVFATAILVFLPTWRYGFVQDDRAIIAENPAAHSVGAAVRAFDQPYWPAASGAGLYRPVTILSYAIDWSVSGGRASWLHVMNTLWHGLICVLLVALVARWLPPVGALSVGLVFAIHPVHVEGVASLVSRAELLVAAAILGALLAARRRWWWLAVLCALLAMFSKEHGVIVGVLILLDDWLQSRDRPRYPIGLYSALGVATIAFLFLWHRIGGQATGDVASPFLTGGADQRLMVALPAVLRAARLLVWPLDLSADYNPQVIASGHGWTLAALGGLAVVAAIPTIAWRSRHSAPALTFASACAALAYLPTSNLLFPSGVVLAERNLYLPVIVAAIAAGQGISWLVARADRRRAAVVVALPLLLLVLRTEARLPTWRDNKSLLLTTLAEHPESYRAHAWAAAVLAGTGDTAGARAQYHTADSLFPSDPHVAAAYALYVTGLGDTTMGWVLVHRARQVLPHEPIAMRAEYLLLCDRGADTAAAALLDTLRLPLGRCKTR